jgi:O-antigen/teichoic acid export membrane protein
MLLLPLISMLIVLSKPLIYFLFSDKYPLSPILLSIRLVPLFLIGFGSLSNLLFLNSQGDTKLSSKILTASSFVSIILSLIFIYFWNVIGLVISFTLSAIIRNSLGLFLIQRKYGISPKLHYTIKTIICSLISGGLVYGYLMNFPSLPIIELFIGVILYLLCFLLLAPFIGVIERRDIKIIDSMFSNLVYIYPFVRLILNVEEKILEYSS